MKNYSVSLRRLSAFALVTGGMFAASLAFAQETTHLITPSSRGLAGTEWAGWDVFTDPYGTPGNSQHLANAGNIGLGGIGDGIIQQTGTSSAFLTGGGNIYSFAAATSFSLTDSTAYTLGAVTFQAVTLGNLMNYDSVLLRYDNGSGLETLTTARVELYNGAAGGMGGADVTSLWQWDVSALGINSYEIVFSASASSMSLAAASLDTVGVTAVPEPATGGLLAGAAALMFVGRLRRRTA